ncbi:MAG: hypothetical protein LPD71_14770 [Shewanella sp.]|nr:hypothetical protein [Shewanella sp.]MCF1429624.1 hypothetical protein [Shewanella sp.]MCF1439950.1 hypothetical protein [Shewanella sp.]MCF1458403.1 hypothetical protein [Shewanella sp.]
MHTDKYWICLQYNLAKEEITVNPLAQLITQIRAQISAETSADCRNLYRQCHAYITASDATDKWHRQVWLDWGLLTFGDYFLQLFLGCLSKAEASLFSQPT